MNYLPYSIIFNLNLYNVRLMIEQGNIFSRTIQEVKQTEQESQNIDYIIQNARAIHYHMRAMLKKCFYIMLPYHCRQHYFLKCYLNRFIEGIYTQRGEKISRILKMRLFKVYKQNKQIKHLKLIKQKEIIDKINNIKNKKILREWKIVINVQKSFKNLQKWRRKQLSNELILLLTQNKKDSAFQKFQKAQQNNSIKKFYEKKLTIICFQSFILNAKIQRLQLFLKYNFFNQFLKHTKILNKDTRVISFQFFRQSFLKKTFLGWKELYQQQVANKFYLSHSLHFYFYQWKNNLSFLISQREIDCNNERIINIYLERSHQRTVQKIFRAWRLQIIQMKQSRHRNSIINSYAQKQSKYTLLLKYFQKLRLNCVNNTVKLRYHNTKLKRKAMDSFKIFLKQSIAKQGEVIKFMQKREVKKYFNKIIQFNNKQNQKIIKYRLSRYFSLLTTTIIAEYCYKNQLACSFNSTNLIYKTLFSLKKQKTARHHEQYVIALVNIILPLRRWLKTHRVKRFINEKNWYMKKSIFREWRIMLIRKDSERKIVREFKQIESAKKSSNNESKLQLFQFQNIMETIAKIRKNLNSQRQESIQSNNISKLKRPNEQLSVRTPSQSVNFSYSLQNI